MARRASTSPPAAGGSVPLRVLIFETDPALADLMVRALRRAHFAPDWQRVQSEQDFLARLAPTFDLILAGWRPPQVDALRALRLMQDRGLDVPFIVVSGTIGEEGAAAILRQGDADCLPQDRLDCLGDVVRRVLVHRRLLDELTAERGRTEEALRKSEERYRGLFNGIPVGLYRATVGGEILDANPAFLKMLRCPDLEILRAIKAGDLYVDPEVRRQWIAAVEKDGVVSGFESQLRRLDGSVIWVTASARIVRDLVGAESYLEGAVEDITERKQVQEATIRAREADRANQAKSEFLSRLSHELRTPLNAMLGFAQLLEMGPLRPDQQESVDQILGAGRHLIQLISEVLEFARIEAGQMTLSLGPIPVSEPVQEALNLISPLAAKANVRLHIEAAGTPQPYIMADRQRVTQIVLNLLSNAVKYNRPGGRIDLSFEDAPQGRLRIKVRDTGPGISPEKIARLFVPFDRLGAEQTEIEGTGLGLVLCKHLVEAMGGSLGVDSVEGQGSTFWVEFVRG